MADGNVERHGVYGVPKRNVAVVGRLLKFVDLRFTCEHARPVRDNCYEITPERFASK